MAGVSREGSSIRSIGAAAEQYVRTNLEAASAAFEAAKKAYLEACELAAGDHNNFDGGRAGAAAAVKQRRAAAVLAAALREFQEYVFHGVLPAKLRE